MHRDLKPGNVLCAVRPTSRQKGVFKLSDFGIATFHGMHETIVGTVGAHIVRANVVASIREVGGSVRWVQGGECGAVRCGAVRNGAERRREKFKGFARLLHNSCSGWTAPEVFGGRPYTQESDIYSIGCLLALLVSKMGFRTISPVLEKSAQDRIVAWSRQTVSHLGGAASGHVAATKK